ncbi:MAG TPA: hypothetical protein VF886_17005 [Roseiarcus sp.]
MQPDKDTRIISKPPANDDRAKTAQAPAQSDAESLDPGSGSVPDLRKAAEDLKTKIDEAKRRNNLPLDSALGNPTWERSVSDGRLDLPDEEDD